MPVPSPTPVRSALTPAQHRESFDYRIMLYFIVFQSFTSDHSVFKEFYVTPGIIQNFKSGMHAAH